METRLISADLILTLSDYLELQDIYSLGGVCRAARSKIRKNNDLWKRLVTRRCPCPLWSKVTLDEEDYMLLILRKRERLEDSLRRYHIFYRLQQPMSSKDALRVFMEITTPGLPAPHDKVILPGTLELDQKGNAGIHFKRNDGKAFLLWQERGEGLQSKCRYYTIDRRNPLPFDIETAVPKFEKCLEDLRYESASAKTILSKDDYAFIMRVLKLDIPVEDKGKIVKPKNQPVPNQLEEALDWVQGPPALVREQPAVMFAALGRAGQMVARDPAVSAYKSRTIRVDIDLWFEELYFDIPDFDPRTGVGLSTSRDTIEPE